jgi:hypothetical protein
VARPIPELAPVMQAILFIRLILYEGKRKEVF